MKHVLLFLAVLCTTCPAALAQFTQTKRLELPYNNPLLDYTVITVKEQGVLLFSPVQSEDNLYAAAWDVVRYDTLLQKVWETRCPVPAGGIYRSVQHQRNGDYFYMLLTQRESRKFVVFRLSIVTGAHEWMEGMFPTTIAMAESFSVWGNTAFIKTLSSMSGDDAMTFMFSFFDKRISVPPAFYEPDTQPKYIQLDPENNIGYAFMAGRKRRHKNLSVSSFDYAGRLLGKLDLSGTQHERPFLGQVVPLNAQERLVVGFYTYKNFPTPQGIFVAKFNGMRREFMKFHPLGELRTFFNFMRPAQRNRTTARMAQRQQEGKRNLFHYQLALRAIVQADRYCVLRMDNLGIANVGLQSVVCGIDKDGNLLWDNSFELMNIARTNFRQMVQVAIEGDKVVFGYPTNGIIHAKAVQNTKTLMDNTTFAANAEGRSRGASDAEKMSLAHWYGAQWLEWGTQVIEGQLNAQGNKQEVFYLNKIAYGPQLTTREDAPQKE